MKILNEIKGCVEEEYLTAIVNNISTKADYDFLFIRWDDEIKMELKNKTIVFIISDEKHLMPSEKHLKPNVEMIFKNYHPINSSHPKVRPLPLGLVNGFCGDNKIKINDRKLDYSFTGAWNPKRKALKKAFDDRKNDGFQKSFFIFKEWCGKEGVGFSIKDYSKILSNTKISLCPPGYASNESFRICESAKCGNIIIAEDPYDFWYNRDLPFFKVKTWENLNIIDVILSLAEDKLEDYSQKTYEWYQNKIQPKSIANYIEKELASLVGN